MRRPITAATRLIVLLGDPVRHSLSPLFQNAAIAAAGLDAVYLALRCDGDSVGSLLSTIAAAGGAGNITLPHKEAAARAVQRASDAVAATGACNTFWLEDGEVQGDNTDVVGFLAAADEVIGDGVAGARVLMVGAGGAASGAVHALLSGGAAEVVIVNRSTERADELVRRFAGAGARLRTAVLDDVMDLHFDLAVNATSLGLRPDDPPPLPLEHGPTFDCALDLVYAPGRTPWVLELRRRGIPADDGLEMLIRQGAASFERWFGIDAPLAAMRAALPAR